jgi:hypothetical protein
MFSWFGKFSSAMEGSLVVSGCGLFNSPSVAPLLSSPCQGETLFVGSFVGVVVVGVVVCC